MSWSMHNAPLWQTHAANYAKNIKRYQHDTLSSNQNMKTFDSPILHTPDRYKPMGACRGTITAKIGTVIPTALIEFLLLFLNTKT